MIEHISALNRRDCSWLEEWPLKDVIIVLIGNNVRISMALSSENIQSRFIGESMEKPRIADTPNHAIQAFVVNRMCKHDDSIFTHEDHGFLFKDNNLWLFIDNDSELETNDSIVSF